jgi:hypothetical protein
MKKIFYFALLLFFFFRLEKSIAQNPTYTLSAENLHLNYYATQLEWDIYIRHTNPPATFEYSGGQYFFDFDPGLIVNGGTLTYSIVGSDLPPDLQPISPSVYLTGGVHQLRLLPNTPPGPGNGYIMTNNGSSNGGLGTLIARVRLSTTTYFNTAFFDPNIVWRNVPVFPATRINAYLGTTNAEITTPNTHSTNVHFPPNTFQESVRILLYSPVYGSNGISLPVNFKWSYNANTSPNYWLKVSTDYQFSNVVFSNSSIADTFYTIAGLNPSTKYYWQVYSYNMFLNCFCGNSAISTFTTGPEISISLKVIHEGLYKALTDRLNRKDSVVAYLRDAASPYALRDSAKSVIDSASFTGLAAFSNAPSGTYYIVVKNINGIETWSKAGGEFLNSTASYDFTTLSSQAFGNNMKQINNSPLRFAIYTGDVNQDGSIDLTDVSRIDNDSYNLVSGYVNTDLNGDDFVDLADLTIADNNAFNFVSVISP